MKKRTMKSSTGRTIDLDEIHSNDLRWAVRHGRNASHSLELYGRYSTKKRIVEVSGKPFDDYSAALKRVNDEIARSLLVMDFSEIELRALAHQYDGCAGCKPAPLWADLYAATKKPFSK